MRSGSMRTGDYLCLSLSGGAPWGFSLQESDSEHPQLLKVTQVEQGCPAALGGLCVGDELVSLNDQPCADLTLPEITALMDGSPGSLRLLIKRCGANGQPAPDPNLDYFEERDTGTKGLESTTLEIWPARHQHPPRELYICESQDEAYYGEAESDAETPGQASWERVHQLEPFTPGSVVELQLSLSDHSLDEGGTLTPPSRQSSSQAEVVHTSTTIQAIRFPGSGPGSGSLGQVEVTLQWPHKGSQGEGTVSEGSDPESSGRAEEDEGAQEALPTAEPLGSSSEEFDSEAEKDGDKPNKHRARHARFRRSESQSEKQVKEAKSKCRRIALLLTAAPSSNNKGVLMFKKHRQRAKKFTLVSYGTGEDAPEDTDEDEDQESKEHTVEFNFFATSESELDEEGLFTETQGRGRIVTFDWDTGLLEIEKKLENPQEMDRLPETKGKGALMFAQRRQRMDEITAEHEEMRRKGIPVEGVQEVQDINVVKLGPYQTEEQSYMQSVESQVYMDVNLQQHHQEQQQQCQQPHYEQPQQYQDQQQYQHQQHYHDQQQQQQRQHYQDQQQQQQRQHYQDQQQQQRQHYQDQQQYQHQQYSQQQQQYQQQQYQQIQQYSQSMNGMALHQATDMQKSTIITNKTAKPFSGVVNKVATPFLPSSSATSQQQTVYSDNQYSTVQTQGWSSVGSGEQIASRDERIAVPAIKTGILQDCRKSASKPMFTFKEAPKMSPNPVLLNLLNKNERKAGFESCPEEDYLSLGAEACNFLQGPRVKQKVPPPVAPKPAINPASPPWSPPPASGDQVPSHLAENEVTTTASATAAVSLLSPGSAPAPVAAPAPMPEVPLSTQPHAAVSAWSPLESQRQPEPPDVPQDKEQPHQPESALASTFGSQSQPEPQPPLSTWSPAQTQSQAPVSTWAPAPTQVEPQPPVSSWTPVQTQAQQPVKAWNPAQTHTQAQPQPPVSAWIPAHAQAPQQPPRSSPVQLHTQQKPQTHMSSWPGVQQQPNLPSTDSAWTQDPAQAQAQPSWASPRQPQLQEQSKPGSYVSSWPPAQTQAQTQPSWSFAAQPQSQAQTQPQSLVSSWPPPPTSPPWPSPPQLQAQQQPSMSTWAPAPPQTHPEPPMNAWAPAQSQLQPSWTSLPQTQAPPQAPVSTLTSSHTHGQPQLPVSGWGPAQAQGPPQPPWASQPSTNSWRPQPLAPVSSMATNQGPSASHQPVKSWNQPQSGTSSLGHPPPRRTNSYTPSTPPGIAAIAGGIGSAFEMPALRGKGAELFAKRQSRMEKFVVDSSTVQTNKVRSVSPTPSLPSSWKYTSNVRAPPPLAYNPIHSPSYPPGAIKQSPASSPSANAKGKGKDKPSPKPLHVLDVMKHQPYQLNSSLFTYGAAGESKGPPSKLGPAPVNNNQPVRYEQFPPTQPSGPMNAPYTHQPQQPSYGFPSPSSSLQEGPYQQGSAPPYRPAPNSHFNQGPSNTYQQPPNPYYQPTPSPPFHPDQDPVYQQPQSPPYPPAPTQSYQLGPSPPYQEPPTPTFQPSPSAYVAPSYQVPPKPASVTGGPTAAPRPKFSAKKSAAQEPGKSYSLSLPRKLHSSSPRSERVLSGIQPPEIIKGPCWGKRHKPPTPWEAASRHPLGLVDEAFSFQSFQKDLASGICSAAHRKSLPEPPAEWKARVSYEPRRGGGEGAGGCRFAPTCVASPTRSVASAPAAPVPYVSPWRWQAQRSSTESEINHTVPSPGHRGGISQPGYTSTYTMPWRR